MIRSQFMPLKIYCYNKCGTCRKALKYLDEKNIDYTLIPIRETPPTKTELKKMVKFMGGEIKKLFNTSGQDYKSMNLKQSLPTMTDAEKIELLATNGNLVKRPFALSANSGIVGFKEADWDEFIQS